MSVILMLNNDEEDGHIRIRVETPEGSATSRLIDPIEFIYNICAAINVDIVDGVGGITLVFPPLERGRAREHRLGTGRGRTDPSKS